MKKVAVAIALIVASLSLAGCFVGKGKGKAPAPVVTKGANSRKTDTALTARFGQRWFCKQCPVGACILLGEPDAT